MVELFGVIFLWGIPALLIWSIVLSIIHMIKEPVLKGFFGRLLTFISHVIYYAIHSFGSWVGLISIIFGIAGFAESAFWGPLFMVLFGVLMAYFCFPRYKMPE